MKNITVAGLQELLDQLPEEAEVTGINYRPVEENSDEFSCCIYVTDEVKCYRVKFWYTFKKSLASIFIESGKR